MTPPSVGGVAEAVKAWLPTASQKLTYVSGVAAGCACAFVTAAAPPSATANAAMNTMQMLRTFIGALLEWLVRSIGTRSYVTLESRRCGANGGHRPVHGGLPSQARGCWAHLTTPWPMSDNSRQ